VVPEVLYYFLDSNSQPKGPANLATIRGDVKSGMLPADVRVAIVGGNEWVALASV
jgi:hypothetical protein